MVKTASVHRPSLVPLALVSGLLSIENTPALRFFTLIGNTPAPRIIISMQGPKLVYEFSRLEL